MNTESMLAKLRELRLTVHLMRLDHVLELVDECIAMLVGPTTEARDPAVAPMVGDALARGGTVCRVESVSETHVATVTITKGTDYRMEVMMTVPEWPGMWRKTAASPGVKYIPPTP